MRDQLLPIISLFIFTFVLVKALIATFKVKGNGLGFEEVVIAAITIASGLNIFIGLHDVLGRLDFGNEYFYEVVFGRNMFQALSFYAALHYVNKLYPTRLKNKEQE